MNVRSDEISALGLRTRVLSAGPCEESEAVVLLHGVPGSANQWDDLLPRLGGLARAVAFDLPGFGRSDKPRDWEYSPNAYANFIAAALDQLGIERAHLVMSDLGGVGLFWAAAHPAAFASAVLIDTGVAIGVRHWHAVGRIYRAPVAGTLAVAAGRVGFGPVMRFYTAVPRPLARHHLETMRAEYDRGARRALKRFYRGAAPPAWGRIAGALRPLDRPALVLWGAHDRFTSVEQAARQREAFPSAEVVVLDDSGHYSHLDAPEAVAAHVVPFLQRQLAPAAANSRS